MRAGEFRTIEMFGNVVGFRRTQARNVPPDSLAATAFDGIESGLARISEMGSMPERFGPRPGTTARDEPREVLRNQLVAMHQTSLAVSIDKPGTDVYFLLPDT